MIFASRVAESSTTTGTGAFALGGAVAGYRAFSGLPLGLPFPYMIEAVDANGVPTGAYEYGIGELSAATTLQRRIVIGSSNSDALVNFAAGSKRVALVSLGELQERNGRRARFLWAETDLLGIAGAATVEASVPWDVVVISSGTQAKIAATANHPGILRFSSSTTANSGVRFTMDPTGFLLGGGELSIVCFRPQVLTGTTIRAGFLDTTTASDAVDGVYFEMNGAGEVVGKTANNSARTTSAILATLSSGEWVTAICGTNWNASEARFFLYSESGTLLGSETITTNIPTGGSRQTGHGVVATNSGTTASALVDLDYLAVGVLRPLTR